jgi:hypothetical protein
VSSLPRIPRRRTCTTLCAGRYRDGRHRAGVSSEEKASGGAQVLAGDPAGVGAGEEGHDVRDVGGPAQPAERGEGGGLLLGSAARHFDGPVVHLEVRAPADALAAVAELFAPAG